MAGRHLRGLKMGEFLAELARSPGLVRQQVRELRKRSCDLRMCGHFLHFQYSELEERVRLANARLCKQPKLCPMCAVGRGGRLLRRYSERAAFVLEHRSDLVGEMHTYTIRNREDLGSAVGHLLGSFDKLTQRVRDSRMDRMWAGAGTSLARLKGAAASVEVKRGSRSGLWHPHIHMAAFSDQPTDEDQLRREWRELTGDSDQVKVKPFHYQRLGMEPTAENLGADFCEVFKYNVKLNELDFADTWHAHQVLLGRRLFRSFGCLYGVKLPADQLDDGFSQDDLEWVDWFYEFTSGEYKLRHVESGGRSI